MKYVLVFIIMVGHALSIANKRNSTDHIPSAQFKLYNFDDEIWHPHLSRANFNNDDFILVDNYKEHLHKPKMQSWLQMNQDSEHTRDLLTRNFYDDELMSDIDLPGQNKTNKGPFNCA